MKHIFTLILFFATTAFAFANENNIDNKNMLPLLPSCNEAKVHLLINEKISEYYKKNPRINLFEKRMQNLMRKNMKEFEELDVSAFGQQDNRLVANKLLTIKINNGLDASEIRLCKSKSLPHIPSVYLLIYPDNYYYKIDIINFAQSAGIKDFFVIYE